ncbi:MAG: hypothetical protein K2X86_02295 [Cytophagaceae bacterium]|nr:hypothetical protein [Cytophagaceae bacterium]
MRVLAEIPREEFKITVFSWNGKYLVKFERGNYEQTYKIAEMDLTGDGDMKKLIEDENFLKEVTERFKEMSRTFKEAIEKI